MVCKVIVTVDEMNNGDASKIAKKLRREQLQRGVLYKTIRTTLGLSQTQFAKLIGTTKQCIVQRERVKRVYSVSEIVELQRLSKMTPLEYWQLLEVIAK